MCLENRLPLEEDLPSIGYKLLIKVSGRSTNLFASGRYRFIIDGSICGSGRLTATRVLLSCELEDSVYESGFHFSATPRYLSYLLMRHYRILKKKVNRDLGLSLDSFELVICQVSVGGICAKGKWWSDIGGGDTAYVARYMEVLEEVDLGQCESSGVVSLALH